VRVEWLSDLQRRENGRSFSSLQLLSSTTVVLGGFGYTRIVWDHGKSHGAARQRRFLFPREVGGVSRCEMCQICASGLLVWPL
jgi:hypothetical protein